MTRYLPKAIAVTALCVVFAGCATTSELDEVKAELAKVQQTANEAKAQATQADANAAQALQAANTANSKIDRAYKKAVQK